MPSSSRAAIALGLALALAACAKSEGGSGSPSPAATPAAPQTSVSPLAGPEFGGAYYASQGHEHVTPARADKFRYNSNPPTSGPHVEAFNDAFVSPKPLPKYIQVHLLEHGNVLLQYNCSCPGVETALAKIAGEYDTRLLPPNQLQPTTQDVQNAEEQGLAVIVAPYSSMKSRIALTAWTRLASLSSVDAQKVVAFINKYLHNAVNASQ